MFISLSWLGLMFHLDPIEAGAIEGAFKNCSSMSNSLFVGSIKSNIGHLEGTSGVAGLIKSVLTLEQGIIPGIAGLDNVNLSIKENYKLLKVVIFFFLKTFHYTGPINKLLVL